MFNKARDPLNAQTHFYGIIFSLISAIIFIFISITNKTDIKNVIGAMIFSLSMFFLYSSSTIYHYSTKSKDIIKRLRKLDHSMIYVLIVGSYSPFIIKFLNTEKVSLFLTVMWSVAIIGIIAKICWDSFPSILSTIIYIVLGWSIVFDTSIIANMTTGCILMLAAGGISYTIGGIIYAIKKPNCFKHFKHHEIFHVFVLLGSFFHFLTIAIYTL